MQPWRILLADGLEQQGREILRQECQVDDRKGLPAAEFLAIIGQYDAIVMGGNSKLTAEVLRAGKKLRVVGRAGLGVENIDLAAAARQGIQVVNAPAAAAPAVAEFTLGAILALARSLPRADATIKAGLWLKKEFQGVEIQGKTLGVIGMGQVGGRLNLLAGALGMQVTGYDPWLGAEEISRMGVEAVSLDALYRRGDFISVHVPLTAETHGLLGGQAFAQMKRGVRIVCTMPGRLVDETALLGALESGQVAGAALDVFASEPPGLSGLVAHPNVIATPHISPQTEEAGIRTAEDIAREVLAALRGDPLRWRIV